MGNVVVSPWQCIAVMGFVACASACARAPSPLSPAFTGSIGLPHRGVLIGGSELPQDGEGLRWLRQNDRHWALPRFADAIARAAASVAEARPGSPPLYVGDLSVRTGGVLMPHFSHRNGRDADLLLFATTLDGVPVASPGFVHFGPDGLAWDAANRRFLRLDVEREWLLVKALVEDDEARVQWLFANHAVEALLIEWAVARGEPAETVFRAERAMLEPHPGGEHDDHIHVRTACAREELAQGCEPSGPVREWLDPAPAEAPRTDPATDPANDPANDRATDDASLVVELLRPIEAPASVSLAP